MRVKRVGETPYLQMEKQKEELIVDVGLSYFLILHTLSFWVYRLSYLGFKESMVWTALLFGLIPLSPYSPSSRDLS
jgi:hypothetical protein